MKELSTETINIGGVDYTLFLNRKGIVAFENYTKSEKEKYKELLDKYKDLENTKEFDKLEDDANPFENLEYVDNLESDIEFTIKLYERLYWIMLYTNHKLKISEVSDLFKKAIEEYGAEQLIELGQQMIDEVNTAPNNNKELKNLTALKPKKK